MDFKVYRGGHSGEGVSDTGCQRWTSRYAGVVTVVRGCQIQAARDGLRGILGWTQGCGHRGEGSVRYRLPEMDFEVYRGGHSGEGVSDTGCQRWTSRYTGVDTGVWGCQIQAARDGLRGILGWTQGCGHRGEGVSDTGCQRWTSRYTGVVTGVRGCQIQAARDGLRGILGQTQGCEGILGRIQG